jgi:transcriptional regulator of acetoin/glycerol metabolism
LLSSHTLPFFGLSFAQEIKLKKDMLRQYSWPGNVWELMNMLLEAAIYAPGQRITAADLPPTITRAAVSETSQSRRQVLDRAEADLILQALQQTGGVTRAALHLGLHNATLYRRMKKYGIALPSERNKNLT